MESGHNIKKLFDKFLNRNCSPEELEQLFAYFHTSDETSLRRLIASELDRQDDGSDDSDRANAEHLEYVHRRINAQILKSLNKKKLIYRILPYAAAILLIAGFSIYMSRTDVKLTANPELVSEYGGDVMPGKDQAILTLADGEKITLSDSKDGILIDGTNIRYSDNDEVVRTSEIQYVTLATPRAGQYRVVLPDGSKVWLNAESSLHYPTAFMGNERRVELTGEGYFEIINNTEQPFIVESASQQVKVLGTEFNISAYDDKPIITTTLVEGSIELRSTANKMVKTIKPYQQAILGADDFQITTVDVKPYIAWKNGEFRFKATPLHEALRQIERWYDIEVDYDNVPDDIEIYAYIRRDKRLSSVLFALEEITDIKFKIEGRRLMLMK